MGKPNMRQLHRPRNPAVAAAMTKCDLLLQPGQNTNFPKATVFGGTARWMAKVSLKMLLVPGHATRTRFQESAIGGRAATGGSGSDRVAYCPIVRSLRSIIACLSCCCVILVDRMLVFAKVSLPQIFRTDGPSGSGHNGHASVPVRWF